MDKETKSNLDQWVSEYPKFSNLITNSGLTKSFGNNPPPKKEDPEWSYLEKLLNQ